MDQTAALRKRLESLRDDSREYFNRVAHAVGDIPPAGAVLRRHETSHPDVFERLDPTTQEGGDLLRSSVRRLMAEVASAAQSSLLLGETDVREIGANSKAMVAALRFRRFREYDLYVHHDEGIVLGVTPAHQSDDETIGVEDARRLFTDALKRTLELTDYLAARRPALEDRFAGAHTITYRKNTAFVMMWINPNERSLDDVRDTIRDVFAEFGITATRADDIEHDEGITERIIDEIRSAEFLFADLTGERPSVYYEVGYAHALGKRVILFRKNATRIHFDLAHRNCPEYDNLGDLRKKLRKRLETLTNRAAEG